MERSNRNIEGESFIGSDDLKKKLSEREIKRAGEPDRSSLPSPSLKQKAIIQYRNVKSSIKNKVQNMYAKKAEKVIRKKVPDNTLWGKIIFAILDVIPLPNFHEIWKAVQKEIPNAPFKDKMKLYWEKIDGVRTTASIIISLLTAYYLI
ncbi:hypothetical protein [Marinospirillum sp.]|uniref:hypothetical protein n=1 Tax=Marinospirillum sp. TaxID=2183934 RepID=UPI003A881491